MSTISDIAFEKTAIDYLTCEGELYRRLDDKGTLECFSCGHRCTIKVGRRGICKVRYNADGVLRVPWGYVGALQCDPTEKKPFFHIYPGSDTLTFGMLGCDFHCPYCVSASTRIATAEGLIRIDTLFAKGETVRTNGKEEIRRSMSELVVYTHTGQPRRVQKMFRHPYKGKMMRVRAWYMPALECTPEHEFLVLDAPPDTSSAHPHFVRAAQLTKKHLLAIPKHFSFSHPIMLDTAELLRPFVKPYRAQRTIGRETLEAAMKLTAEGLSSREIGKRLGMDAFHVRHLWSKFRRDRWDLERLGEVHATLAIENGGVRLPTEHRPGIPLTLSLDTQLAKLLGYYCSEGCVSYSKDRVHAATLYFSFGRHAEALADEVIALLQAKFNVHAQKVYRDTTTAVAVDKTSVALCFEALCGHDAHHKRVPPALYQAPREVAESFLRAYAADDGNTDDTAYTSTGTLSEELAHGVAWLALKLGMLPAVYAYRLKNRLSTGRQVNTSPYAYSVNWYFDQRCRTFAYEDADYWYVRIRSIDTFDFEGDVYNLAVEGEHSYLANLIATHNCQNWETSQVLRDPHAEGGPTIVTPEQLVGLAKRYGAKLVGSSYNEPLITSEWAVEVFKAANREGFQCVYISNGNLTPEVLQYIRPHLVGYKIDLKSMRDKPYRQLGGVLQNVLNGIKLVHEAGLWLEIVTLVVPGFNDSNEELRDAANYLASISKNIPWHVTAFHQDYKMTDPDNTDAKTLLRAAEIGKAAGLKFVYAGNLPGQVGPYENTWCPKCNALLIERFGYVILDYRLTDDGHCPDCGEPIPGVWGKRSEVRLGGLGDLFRRIPRPVMRFRSDVYEN